MGRRHRSDSVFCNYAHRICMQDRLDGSEYCLGHVMEDKSAPYKHCTFISSKGGRRCLQPAPKSDKRDGYCTEHAQKVAVLRHRKSLKPFPRPSNREILESLDRYHQDPTKPIIEVAPEMAKPSLASRILDGASESESDDDPLRVDQSLRGVTDSDAESIDSEQEDLLKHAGVYTPEEVALITREKLIRLQSLYINQFKRLQHLMREKRRKYLSDRKLETEMIGPGLGTFTTPKEKRSVRRLQAMQSYHRRHGREALLHKRSKHRRIKATPNYVGSQKVVMPAGCKHSDGGRECAKPGLPIAGYCLQHILHDPDQVLYLPCSKGLVPCLHPANPVSLETTCLLHTPIGREWSTAQNPQPTQDTSATVAMADHDYLQRPSEGADTSDHDVDIMGMSGEHTSLVAESVTSQFPTDVIESTEANPTGGQEGLSELVDVHDLPSKLSENKE